MTPVLTLVLLGIVVPLALNECGELSPWLAKRLLLWSARRLRDPVKIERYSEEWLADLERVPGKLTKLLSAVWVSVCGIIHLRAHRTRVSWEPRSPASPFEDDSIFGPGNSLMRHRVKAASPARTGPDPAPWVPAPQPRHHCAGLCTLFCGGEAGPGAATSERRAWPEVKLPRPFSSLPPEPTLAERVLGAEPPRARRYRYPYVDESIFEVTELVVTPVIGE